MFGMLKSMMGIVGTKMPKKVAETLAKSIKDDKNTKES